MQPVLLPRLKFRVPIAAVFVALPACIFYSILLHTAVNLPVDDDYEALLNFLNQFLVLKGVSAKTSYFVAAQFNEYKLFLGHGIAWLQLALLGHVDIRILCAVGNAFILLLAILLWKMFLPDHGDRGDRLILFIPISWLLFQLQYAETLNWAMPSLQNVPIFLFAFGSIFFLVRSQQLAFGGALACLVLAVAASGNGFLLVPIGLLILALNRNHPRRYLRIAAWLFATGICIAGYAYRYNVMSSQSRMQQSVLATVIRPRPLYVIAFVGSTASFPYKGHHPDLDIYLSLLLGGLLSVFFVALWRRGYVRKNPAVAYSVVFLFLTAVGVAGLRSDFGIAQSLGSRYSIYSLLFLIFAWFAIVEEFLVRDRHPFRRNVLVLVIIAVAILYSLIMDQRGTRYLASRDRKLIIGMTAYEHPGTGPGPIIPSKDQGARFDELDRRAPEILRQAARLGIYQPPSY